MSGGLKELRTRIKSIKSTQKITKAMKVVSAAKLRRAKAAALYSSSFSARIYEMVAHLKQSVIDDELDNLAKIVLFDCVEVKQNVIIVIAADRGLCGSFNASMMRKFNAEIDSYVVPKLIVLGKKAHDFVVKKRPNDIVFYSRQQDITSEELGSKLLSILVELFEKVPETHVTLFYTKFKSVMSQVPVAKRMFPIEIDESYKSDGVIELHGSGLIKILMDLYLRTCITEAVLDSRASEESARMTAMDSANRNAGEMLNKLTLIMNRKRQSLITNELIEVISGAEAV